MLSCDTEIMESERPRWLRSMAALWSAGCQNLIFPGLWLLIGVISAIDTYLTVKFRESLMFLETNPIANILLDLDQGDGSLLIGFKFLGSTLALGILAALYMQNRRRGLMVSSGLACFQVGLLYYLLVV